MAQTVRGAVEAGEYASSSEIIREALRLTITHNFPRQVRAAPPWP
jgi:Arc/MetJ-type ribon-helix-helix transcriptional regulator